MDTQTGPAASPKPTRIPVGDRLKELIVRALFCVGDSLVAYGTVQIDASAWPQVHRTLIEARQTRQEASRGVIELQTFLNRQ